MSDRWDQVLVGLSARVTYSRDGAAQRGEITGLEGPMVWLVMDGEEEPIKVHWNDVRPEPCAGRAADSNLGPYAQAAMRARAAHDAAHLPWRVGRKIGRTIYAQVGGEPSDSDPLIGVMDTIELALEAAQGHNALLRRFGP